MNNPDTDLLFPLRVIPDLADLRGEKWRKLVNNLCLPDTPKATQSAFVLMMVKLGGCATCNSDSFRAMRGCTQCAQRTIRRFKGEDEELIREFEANQVEYNQYLEEQKNKVKHRKKI